MRLLPETIVPGVTDGESEDSEELNRYHNVSRINVKMEGATGNGVDNDSDAIAEAYALAPAGAIIDWPAGLYMVDPDILHLLASRRMQGAGQYGTVIKLRSNTPGAAVHIDTPLPGATTRGVYGPMLDGIGIDLSAAPSATGVKIDNSTGWAWLNDVRIEGGAISLDNRAANSKVTNSHFVNPSTHFVYATEAGLELRMTDVIFTLSAGNLPAAFRLVHATTGPSGAIYMTNVQCNNGGTIQRGFWGVAPSGRASVPIVAFDVVWDNIAGPSWELEYLDDVKVIGGWANSAAGTDNPAVKVTGGHKGMFIGTKMNGGAGAGASSVEFAGGSPYAWQFIGNDPNTGPIYRLSGASSGDPTNLVLQDVLPLSKTIAIGNVTNESARLRAAMAQLWTPLAVGGQIDRRESGPGAPCGYATLVNGVVTVAHPSVGVNTRIKVARERINGTAGHIFSSVVDNVVGTSFKIRSDSATDNGGVYWEMYDPL